MSTMIAKARMQANQEALERIAAASPQLVGVAYAHELLDFPDKTTPQIQHAGPPLAWDEMCGPLKGAILGVCVYESWAANLQEAQELAESGKISFVHNHERNCVGPMTGMISYSMPLFIVENTSFGNRAYSSINEGVGKVMRFGANDEEVIARLRWLEKSFAPLLAKALEIHGPLDLKVIASKALAMGDELHQRNIAASALFYREMASSFQEAAALFVEEEKMSAQEAMKVLSEISQFFFTNEQFFLNLAMAAAKASIDPIKGIEYCSLVSAMSRNGTKFGIKVSALGDQWFEAPVEMPQGLYFPGFSEKDANPDIGDSAITECVGFGGMAMASAPAVTQFLGLDGSQAAFDITEQMFEICAGKSQVYKMPSLNFEGTPSGIDIVSVLEKGIRPYINSGIAHKKPGLGQVGAGVVFPPMSCFEQALLAYADKYGL